MLTTCNQFGCAEPGLFRYTWPGRDEATICAAHVGHLQAIAAALGLHLQIRLVTQKPPRVVCPRMLTDSRTYIDGALNIWGALGWIVKLAVVGAVVYSLAK